MSVDCNDALKPSSRVPEGAQIIVGSDHPRWVSRGALKLLHAIETFDISVGGKRAIDVGASTGGFTEVLLAKGASGVVAIDVGVDQLAASLRNDPRVVSFDGRNVREISAGEIGPCGQIVVADLSFISLTKVVDKIMELGCPEADLILLIKPQFEVGPRSVGRGGLVKDPVAHASAVEKVIAAYSAVGADVRRVVDSPIEGGDGNKEFLLWCRKGAATEGDT